MNLLIFTALILLVFGLILQSNPKIRTNQCCFVGGCIFAGGVLKEYLYYHMGPKLIEKGIWTAHFSELLYGALSTLLYYFALPTVMVFCYYFCGLDQKMSRFFRSVCLLSYLPAVIMCISYPWQNIIIYQKDRVFCLNVGFYNVGYAALAIGLARRGAVVLYDKLYLVPVDASGLVQLFRHEFADFLHVLPFAGEGPGNRRHEADFDGGGKGE